MANETFPRDRFDDVSDTSARIGAHRAENPRLRGWIVFLWAAIATVVLVLGGIFATMIVSERIVLFPEAVATPTATPDVPSVVDTTYDVLVLNATTQSGLAAGVKETIVEAGWKAGTVYATDAAARDFPQTTVYYALPEDEAAARGLAGVIGGAQVEESAQYQPVPTGDSAAKQLTVVIGLDRTAATPTL